MTIWEMIPDSENYHCLTIVDTAKHAEMFRRFRGQPLSPSWEPIAVSLSDKNLLSDFPSLPGGMPPVCGKRALKLLLPLVGSNIEALPLISDDAGELCALNILDVADCLDHKRSEINYLPSGGVMYISKYVFREHCLDGRHL